MKSGRVLIGKIKGPPGSPGKITKVTAEVLDNDAEPKVDVDISGEPDDQWVHFTFDGIRGLPARFLDATVTTDNTHSDNPAANVEIIDDEDNRGQLLNFDFTGLVGPPAEITEVTAQADGTYLEQPIITTTIDGPAGSQSLHFDFVGFRGERGPTGAATNIKNVEVSMDDVESGNPSCEMEITGETGDQTLHFYFKGLRGPIGRFKEVTATADATHLDEPTVDVTIGGDVGGQTLNFAFSGLQGPQGIQGPMGPYGTVEIATTEEAGKVKPDGTSIKITEDGTISVDKINVATVEEAGIVKPDGATIRITEDGTISSLGTGPIALEVEDGHLFVYYDDGVGEPNIYIDENGHLIWTYEDYTE